MKTVIAICMLFFFTVSYAQNSKKILIDDEVEVLRADFKEVHFLVPEKPNDYEFQVSFRTKGGFNDDIIFLVLTQENYVRWYSKYDFQAAVKTQKISQSDFKVQAKPGETYYFVMDNFFSGVSNKKVKLKISLSKVNSQNS
jgi:hypothetical protein